MASGKLLPTVSSQGNLISTGHCVITTNRVFKDWPEILNNDSKLTSVLLDRLLHHTEGVVIEGDSYRMRKVTKE